VPAQSRRLAAGPTGRALQLYAKRLPKRLVSSESHTCLLVGDTHGPQMRPVEAAVSARFPDSRLRRIDRLPAAGRTGFAADLIVVCQSWSDEHAADEVETLLSAAPLARILCVYGRWCDSDGRTRSIWPLAVRVPAAEFETRLAHELEVLEGTRPPLPLTASRAEIFAAWSRPALNACSIRRDTSTRSSPET